MSDKKETNAKFCCNASDNRTPLKHSCKDDCACGCKEESNSKCSCSAKTLASYIKNGAIGVLETDTIYGLVGSAFHPDVVARIYQVKLRDITKPFIVLISDVEQLRHFGVDLTKELMANVRMYWPGPYSIIMPTTEEDKFEYLTRGTGTISFRMPDRTDLFELIDLAGPIVAPSANPEGQPPAKTINEAYGYFGETIDFYCDAGFVDRASSKLVIFENGGLREIRS